MSHANVFDTQIRLLRRRGLDVVIDVLDYGAYRLMVGRKAITPYLGTSEMHAYLDGVIDAQHLLRGMTPPRKRK